MVQYVKDFFCLTVTNMAEMMRYLSYPMWKCPSWAYTDSKGPHQTTSDHIPTFQSGPSLSACTITGSCVMYQCIFKDPVRLCSLTDWSVMLLFHTSKKIHFSQGSSTILTHLCRVNSSTLTLDRFIFYIRGIWLVFIIVMFCRNIWT